MFQTRSGACRLFQACPPHIALGDAHHSFLLRVRLAASRTNESSDSPTSSNVLFIASVMASASWRARYSSIALAYNSLLDLFCRRAKCSALRNTSSEIDMAVFIPEV